jgi:site-specific recombinase XerD
LLEFLNGNGPEGATRTDLNAFVDHLYRCTTRWDTGSKYHSPRPGPLSKATIGDYIAATKRFYSWLVERDIREDNPAEHLIVPSRPKKKPKALRPKDFVAMLEASVQSRIPQRDRAVLLLLYNTGIRLGGLASLELRDLEIERGRMTIREKGDKERYAYFNQKITGAALREWLAVRPDGKSEAVFTTATGEPLKKSSFVSMLRRLAKRAGIKGPFRPHSFRHRFALEQLDAGVDVAAVARMMGHSSPKTTLTAYARWTDADVERKARENDAVLRLFEES